MLSDIRNAHDKIVGIKQVTKCVEEGLAERVYLATDVDAVFHDRVMEVCAANGVTVQQQVTMDEMGKACGIHVGAAVVAILKK